MLLACEPFVTVVSLALGCFALDGLAESDAVAAAPLDRATTSAVAVAVDSTAGLDFFFFFLGAFASCPVCPFSGSCA